MKGGVAHSAALRDAGFSSYDMSTAVASGLLARVRRSWLITPDCDGRKRAAAALGGRVTCVSAAAMHGFWVPTQDPVIHIAVARTASRLEGDGVRLHWGRGPVPVGRHASDDPMLNVLFHVAHCLPRPDALAVWESAIRARAADPEVLIRVQWHSERAAVLAGRASSLSDSGLETLFVDALREMGVSVRQQVWIDGHPVDGLIGESLVTQIDGFAHHSRPQDRRRDIEADARLVLRGFVVLRFDYVQILFHRDQVMETIATAMAQGAHRKAVSAPPSLSARGR